MTTFMKMYIAVGGSQKTTASMIAQSTRELINRQRKPLREGGSVVAAALLVVVAAGVVAAVPAAATVVVVPAVPAALLVVVAAVPAAGPGLFAPGPGATTPELLGATLTQPRSG